MGLGKWIVEHTLKSVKLSGGTGAGYNMTTGAITHPPKGTGKSPKVKSKTTIRKGKSK